MPSRLSPVQLFILDCADLASVLDNLDLRGRPVDLLAALKKGRSRYGSLLATRENLSPSPAENRWIAFMLDSLLARLDLLEGRIEHQVSKRTPVQTI